MDNRPREKGFRRRWIAFCIVVAALLVLLLGRLAQFQLLEAGSYERPEESESSSIRPTTLS